jgi:hypothetical protein
MGVAVVSLFCFARCCRGPGFPPHHHETHFSGPRRPAKKKGGKQKKAQHEAKAYKGTTFTAEDISSWIEELLSGKVRDQEQDLPHFFGVLMGAL